MYCPRASTYTLSMEQVVFLPYMQYKLMMQHTFTIDTIHFRLSLTSRMRSIRAKFARTIIAAQ